MNNNKHLESALTYVKMNQNTQLCTFNELIFKIQNSRLVQKGQ